MDRAGQSTYFPAREDEPVEQCAWVAGGFTDEKPKTKLAFSGFARIGPAAAMALHTAPRQRVAQRRNKRCFP
jgi:hypothetical protein